jgi:hypothetical protein
MRNAMTGRSTASRDIVSLILRSLGKIIWMRSLERSDVYPSEFNLKALNDRYPITPWGDAEVIGAIRQFSKRFW